MPTIVKPVQVSLDFGIVINVESTILDFCTDKPQVFYLDMSQEHLAAARAFMKNG